jgi:hypothetical protein
MYVNNKKFWKIGKIGMKSPKILASTIWNPNLESQNLGSVKLSPKID